MHCGPPGNSEIRPANLIRWGESSNKTATHQSAKLLMPRHGSWPLVVVFARHKDSSACRSLLPAERFLGDLDSGSASMSLAAGAPALARPRSAPQLPSSRTAFRSRRCQARHLSCQASLLLSVVPTPPGMANRCLTNRWRIVGTTLPVIEWVVRLGCGSGPITPPSSDTFTQALAK